MSLNQIAFFYNEIKNLCKPDEYNLVLHKHLGDVFYAIGLKDEFERVYGKKLHFIVRPQHEFLMKLFGVDHYAVYNFKSFEKRVLQFDWQYMPYASHESHKFDMLCKDAFSSVPLLNIPFSICRWCDKKKLRNITLIHSLWSKLSRPFSKNFKCLSPFFGSKTNSVLRKI